MATKLKKYNWEQASAMTRTEKATYPWDEWLDGNIWRITQGEDFHPHPLMMERIIRTRATGRGAKVQLRHEPLKEGTNGNAAKNPFGHIVLQRTGENGSKPSTNGSKAKAKAPATKGDKRAAAAARSRVTKAPAKKAAARKAVPAKKVSKRPSRVTVS